MEKELYNMDVFLSGFILNYGRNKDEDDEEYEDKMINFSEEAVELLELEDYMKIIHSCGGFFKINQEYKKNYGESIFNMLDEDDEIYFHQILATNAILFYIKNKI